MARRAKKRMGSKGEESWRKVARGRSRMRGLEEEGKEDGRRSK